MTGSKPIDDTRGIVLGPVGRIGDSEGPLGRDSHLAQHIEHPLYFWLLLSKYLNYNFTHCTIDF